jgi:hypothetical protein
MPSSKPNPETSEHPDKKNVEGITSPVRDKTRFIRADIGLRIVGHFQNALTSQ